MNTQINGINFTNNSNFEINQLPKQASDNTVKKTNQVAQWVWNHKLSLTSLVGSLSVLSCVVYLGAFGIVALFPVTAAISAIALTIFSGSLLLFSCQLSKEEKLKKQERLVAVNLAGEDNVIIPGLDKEKINVRDSEGLTPLMHAIENKNKPRIQMLIDLGADLKIQDEDGLTALHYVCMREGMEDILVKMVEQERNLLNVHSHSQKTPLELALICKKEKNVLHLIKLGADIYKENQQGMLAIHLACQHGLSKVISELIQRDPHLLNIKNRACGNTPLMYTIYSSTDENSEILLNLGADFKIANNQGYTAFGKACISWRLSLVSKMLKKDPEIVYTYIKKHVYEDADLVSPIKYMSINPHLVLEMFLLNLNEWTSIQPLLANTTSCAEVKTIINANLDKILDSSQNKPGANPLKIAILLEDTELFREMKERLGNNYASYLENLKNLDSLVIESIMFKVHSKHFTKGSLITEIPNTSTFELSKFKNLFDTINFENPEVPGYKDPNKLTDEGYPINPISLRVGLEKLIERIKNRTPFLGTPLAGTPELNVHYEKFEALLKNIGQMIEELEDPSEKASHLIDIAIMGLHCSGKIGEAASLYRLLKGQMNGGFESQVCDALRNYRLGIIENWATKSWGGTGYEVHRFNQYMFLLGQKLCLPEADAFTSPDPLSNIDLTSEQALNAFYKDYQSKAIIDFTERFILDSLKTTHTREACIDWLKDHVPSHWQNKKYKAILDKIRKLEREGANRKEIRALIKREDGIIFPVADSDPKEAIELHRQRDYLNHGPKVEAWKASFYSPIFEEIEQMKETSNFKDYLTSKGIDTEEIGSKKQAKEAVIEHRDRDFLYNKTEEKDWKKEEYQPILDAVENNQANNREILQRNGIHLEQDRDFENLLEQVKNLEYLSTVFKYDEEEIEVIGIERVAVIRMLEQMEVLSC